MISITANSIHVVLQVAALPVVILSILSVFTILVSLTATSLQDVKVIAQSSLGKFALICTLANHVMFHQLTTILAVH